MVSLGKSAPFIRAQTAFAYPEPMALPEPNRAGYEEGVLLPLFYIHLSNISSTAMVLCNM